jgi:type IV secretory pathway VirB10-like protein
MSFYWLLLVIFGAILAYNFVLLNKKTVCKADRNTQGFDYANFLNRPVNKRVLILCVIILVTAWIVWLNLSEKNKPAAASAPAKSNPIVASPPAQTTVRNTPRPTQAKTDIVSPPAKAAVQDDQPPVPDWLHVGTAKKEWSLRITSPRTWTKTRPNDRRKK